MYKKEKNVFIDETGSNLQGTTHTHGYNMKGKSLKAQKFVVIGEHVSTIAATSMQGSMSLNINSGGINGEKFYDFICQLLPQLKPYSGVYEQSVVIMNNCSIHQPS